MSVEVMALLAFRHSAWSPERRHHTIYGSAGTYVWQYIGSRTTTAFRPPAVPEVAGGGGGVGVRGGARIELAPPPVGGEAPPADLRPRLVRGPAGGPGDGGSL